MKNSDPIDESTEWFQIKLDQPISKSDEMDKSSASTSTSNMVISDLNDNCILEVLKRLDFADLCATADVCRQFREQIIGMILFTLIVIALSDRYFWGRQSLTGSTHLVQYFRINFC